LNFRERDYAAVSARSYLAVFFGIALYLWFLSSYLVAPVEIIT